MSQRRKFYFPFIPATLVVACCFGVGINNAQESSLNAPSEEALAAIIETIAEVQSEISQRQSERTDVYRELQESEKSLALISGELEQLEITINNFETELAALQSQSDQLQTRKASQQELIGQYLLGAYQNGRQEYFKLLLNQESPALAARTLRYYQFFNEARSNKITAYNLTLDELHEVEVQLLDTTDKLNQQRQSQSRQQASLQDNFKERQALLDELDVLLSDSNQRLAALEAERDEMQLLIEELRRSIANLSLGDQQTAFASLKGKLQWPVIGSQRNRWGSRVGLGDLNWEGITIDAPQGSDVKAVHHGRVVFSDWFSSSGLLLIIDHGGGYMSLYAHNQELFREVGEWVNSGEIIASVGNTGGQEDYGLYFEIRHDGESENPSGWLTARN